MRMLSFPVFGHSLVMSLVLLFFYCRPCSCETLLFHDPVSWSHTTIDYDWDAGMSVEFAHCMFANLSPPDPAGQGGAFFWPGIPDLLARYARSPFTTRRF
jgi:hypothetical protein